MGSVTVSLFVSCRELKFPNFPSKCPGIKKGSLWSVKYACVKRGDSGLKGGKGN